MTRRATRPLDQPHPGRLDAAHPRYQDILDAHRAALEHAAPGYLDPGTGLFVLTAAALLERGDCCEQGCRHCPFIDGRDELPHRR